VTGSEMCADRTILPTIALALFYRCLSFDLTGASSSTTAENPSFMIIGGMSARQDLCLAVANGEVDSEGAGVALEACAGAIAAGDGREIWKFHQNGQISNGAGGKCIVLQDNAETSGGRIAMTACDAALKADDGRSQWERQGNGQLKLARRGQFCLSQRGLAPGTVDVAANAAVAATSTADFVAHGAAMAVDGKGATYWASRLDDVKSPVIFTIDFGDVKQLQWAEIEWVFPAKSFTMSLSVDGVQWAEVYSTDTNVLKSSNVALGFRHAAKARLALLEPHATYGQLHGHALYGIKSVALHASALQSAVDDCAKAAASNDASDKYFLSHVGEFDSGPWKTLHSELPSLKAAEASLAATVSELADVLPNVASCGRPALLIGQVPVLAGRPYDDAFAPKSSGATPSLVTSSGHGTPAMANNKFDVQSGIAPEAIDILLAEARHTIMEARKAFV